MSSPRIINSYTRYSKSIVVTGAPELEHRGTVYHPTAIRYEWSTQFPAITSVEVIVRKLKKNGLPGQTTSMVALTMGEPSPGWDPAPQWIRDLILEAEAPIPESRPSR